MLQPIHNFIHRVGRLILLDRAADPAANGEIQRNATHVKVYSGGAVRNMSDIGASANHALGSATHTTKAHSELTGVGTGDHHAQLHATAHKSAGGDAVKLDELAAPTDITTLNASTTLHGLLPKLGGGTTNFFRADGTWAAPGGGGGAVTRQGGSTTEATRTATTFAAMISIAALSIAATAPIEMFTNQRKTSGAASAGNMGFILNTTSMQYVTMSTTDRAEDGMVEGLIGSRETNYLHSHFLKFGSWTTTGGVALAGSFAGATGENPTVSITDLAVGGSSATGMTIGATDFQAYTYATS